MRIDPKVLKSARKIARRDYGEERYISAVTEDALSRYIATENKSEDFSSILGQAEFALYERISQKIETEMIETLKVASNRVGNLIATAGYDVALTSVILEQNMKKDKKGREQYEKARVLAAQRMKRRYDKDGAEEIGSLIQENESLKNELEQTKSLIQSLEVKSKDNSANEVIQTLSDSLHTAEESKRLYANYIRSLLHFLNENDTANLLGQRKPIVQILQEFFAKHPKPKGL